MRSRRTWPKRRARSRPDATARNDLAARLPRRRCWATTSIASTANDCDMRFAVFTPPQVSGGPVPVLYYLAGLTCTEETFVTKAGALEHAARLGIMLVAPDTSPRVPTTRRSRSPGISASRPASTSTPRRRRGRSTTACTATSSTSCPASSPRTSAPTRRAAASSGTRWAATARSPSRSRIPEKYRSLSAFAPISAPMQCPGAEGVHADISATIARRGRSTTPCELLTGRQDIPERHPHRPGDRGQISRRAAEARSCWRRPCKARRAAARAAHARRLRPRLLLHPDLHRRSHGLARGSA